MPGVEDVQLFGERAHVRVAGAAAGADPAESIAPALEAAGHLHVRRITPVAASLEDVFIDLIAPDRAPAAAGK